MSASLHQAKIDVPPLTPLIPRRPDPLVGFGVSSQEAIKVWERLRAATDRTGLYPILIGDAHGSLNDLDPSEYATPMETLDKAAAIDVPKWLRNKIREALADLEPEDWPEDVPPLDTITTAYTLDGGPRDDLSIVLVPTQTPWQANAYLAFTAWNYDILPEHHVAVHKYWHDRYGAELVACGDGTLEFKVPRPPATREEALALAKEQTGYCPDIVVQGVGSVEALAAVLLNAPVWYCWWD